MTATVVAGPLGLATLVELADGPQRKRGHGTSPTARSLKYLRELGYLAEVTEHWNAYAKLRKDLWGFCDVLALRDGEILAVQCTSRANVAHRAAKIADHPNVGQVRRAGVRIHVHGWARMASGRYELRVVDCS